MKKSLKELFGIESKTSFDIPDTAPEYGAVPPNPDYVFRQELVRDMVIFWSLRNKRAAMLIGPPGSGKTTLVEQWHERLNQPLLTFTGHKRIAIEDIFGQYLPTEAGGLQWHDGPLVMAARYGWSVLINEFNAIPPEITIALNDIAQSGSRVAVPQTGDIIEPAPGFRIFATMNPQGRDAVRYKGRQAIDPSTRERFYWVEVGYSKAEDERAIVAKALTQSGALADDVASNYAGIMVDVANAVRSQSIGASGRADALEETLSTRVLVDWATYWPRFAAGEHAVHEALRRAFTSGCDPAAAAAIHAIVELKFGVRDRASTAV